MFWIFLLIALDFCLCLLPDFSLGGYVRRENISFTSLITLISEYKRRKSFDKLKSFISIFWIKRLYLRKEIFSRDFLNRLGKFSISRGFVNCNFFTHFYNFINYIIMLYGLVHKSNYHKLMDKSVILNCIILALDINLDSQKGNHI